nr:hypothetical protein Iba_chr08dCG9750 [Ipomoea batatas]
MLRVMAGEADLALRAVMTDMEVDAGSFEAKRTQFIVAKATWIVSAALMKRGLPNSWCHSLPALLKHAGFNSMTPSAPRRTYFYLWAPHMDFVKSLGADEGCGLHPNPGRDFDLRSPSGLEIRRGHHCARGNPWPPLVPTGRKYPGKKMNKRAAAAPTSIHSAGIIGYEAKSAKCRSIIRMREL